MIQIPQDGSHLLQWYIFLNFTSVEVERGSTVILNACMTRTMISAVYNTSIRNIYYAFNFTEESALFIYKYI